MINRMDEESIFCELDSDDSDRFEFINDEKELCHKKDHCLHAVGNTKSLMSCTKMNFVSELTEAYQKTLVFLYTSLLKPDYAGASARKDLSGTGEFMSYVKHTVDVNKASIVDMKTLQDNYKLYRVATQKNDLPLPSYKYIIPLAHAY